MWIMSLSSAGVKAIVTCMRWSFITAALLVVCAAGHAFAEPVTIVAFGDSLTSGYLVAHNQAYPAQLQAVLRKKGYDVTVKNAGLAGDTTQGALKRFDLAIEPGTQICILEFGLNDLRRRVPRKTIDARMAEMIRALVARHIEVLVVGAGGLDLSPVARDNGVRYVQWRLPPHRFRARDGAHYNAEGYRIAVAQMLPQVEAMLTRLAPR
jgi:acyl-CoA thioesterase-1